MTTPFPITIDVDEDMVGPVLRQLDTMPGVLTIHLRMTKPPVLPHKMKAVEPKPSSQALIHGQRRRRDVQRALSTMGVHSVREVIARSLAKGSMHYNLLAISLEKHGLSPKSVNSAITKMAGDKVIERVAPGTYRLTKRGERKYLRNDGQLPHVVHGNGKMPGGSGIAPANNKGVRGLILKALVNRDEPMAASEMRELIVENDYTANNMYGSVAKMREEGLIQRDANGFIITDRGKEAVSTKMLEGEILSSDDAEEGEE